MSGFLVKSRSWQALKHFNIFRNNRAQNVSRRHITSMCLVCCGYIGVYTLYRRKNTLLCIAEETTIQQETTASVHLINKTDISNSVLQNVSIVIRLSYLVILFSPVLLLHLLSYGIYSTSLSNWKWRYVRFALQKAGPAFVKLGQWVSTRRDIFPSCVCETLCSLQTNCYTHSWNHTEDVLQVEIGQNWKDYFEGIDCDPIGSGCVAQVYKWMLSDEGMLKAGCKDNDKKSECPCS